MKDTIHSESNRSQFLIDPSQLNISYEAGYSQLSSSSQKASIFDKLIVETQDILESDDFNFVLENSINVAYSVVLNLIFESFQQAGLNLQSNDGDSFNDPHTIKLPLAKLIPHFTNALIKLDQKLLIAKTLLCLEPLNCFAANIYQAFCDPQASLKKVFTSSTSKTT
jgi:PREDICTED: peroxisomal biogenesis factor 3